MPVATMITTREDEETIAFGLELLKYVLPDKAFFGRGAAKGPALALGCFKKKFCMATLFCSSIISIWCFLRVPNAIYRV